MDDAEIRAKKTYLARAVANGDHEEAARLRAELDAGYETVVGPKVETTEAEPEAEAEAEEEAGPYDGLTKAELAAELEKRGLAKSGMRDELVERLEEDDAE